MHAHGGSERVMLLASEMRKESSGVHYVRGISSGAVISDDDSDAVIEATICII